MQRLITARVKRSIWPLCRPTSQIWMPHVQSRKLSFKPPEPPEPSREEPPQKDVFRAEIQDALTHLAQRLDENDVLEYVSGPEEEPLEYERVQGGGFYLRGLHGLKTDRYHMWLKIGFGRTSSVWVASDLQEKKFVAIKILSGNQTELNDYGVWQELAAHLRISEKNDEAKQSNCITLLDYFYTPALRESDGEHLCLVLPLMRANLDDVINPKEGPAPTIPMSVTKKVLRSVLKAIKFLHQNNIAHREITPRDVMIAMDPQFDVTKWTLLNRGQDIPTILYGPGVRTPGFSSFSVHPPRPTMDELAKENTEFVLSDLGTARLVDLPLVDAYTTLSLRPPETLLGSKWDQSVDIWNFGTMAYNLLTRKRLFPIAPTRIQLISMWPPPLRPPEIKRAFVTDQAIPNSADWLLYHMSSVCESDLDLPVGSFPKELLESWDKSDVAAGLERKRTRFFDEQGRLKAFTWLAGEHKKCVKLKRSSFFNLLESAPVPMALEERKGAAEFLGRCVRLDPKERASAAELLEHDFLKV